MRLALLFSLAAMAGCSSPGAVQGAPAPETVRVVGGSGGSIAMGMSGSAADARSVAIAASVPAVWRALPAAYESLSIPISVLDSVTHVVGNSGFNVRRRLGSVPLVRLIDCGTTQGGPSAETYDIRLSVTTQIKAADAGTTISTTIEPKGKPVAFSGEYINCSSTGVLETRIADAVKSRIAQ